MALSDKRYIYLAGKIKLGHSATGYRSIIAPILRKHGIHSLDPLRGKYMLRSWQQLNSNEIVMRDLRDIERAHVVLAVMMKCKDSSFGTPCEIMYAWERRIPVIMITDEKYLAEHFWTRSLCSNIFIVNDEVGDTFDVVLAKVAEHIGTWYGVEIEKEIYEEPKIAQEKDCDCSDKFGKCRICIDKDDDKHPEVYGCD